MTDQDQVGGQSPLVTLYTKGNCPLCDSAKKVLLKVQTEQPFMLREVDIEGDPALWEAYQYTIPVVTLDGEEIFYGKVSAHRLKELLQRRQTSPRRSLLSPRYAAFLKRLKAMLQQDRRNCP